MVGVIFYHPWTVLYFVDSGGNYFREIRIMILAVVSKLNSYIGDPTYERVQEEFNSAQEEGLTDFELDVRRLEPEIRLDFMVALEALGYQVWYSQDEELLEVVYE
jgi:hypothetical protein